MGKKDTRTILANMTPLLEKNTLPTAILNKNTFKQEFDKEELVNKSEKRT